MAKEIQNPIEVMLKFEKIDDIWEVESVIHYGVGATEYSELNIRKSLGMSLTPTQATTLKNFAKDIVYPQILLNEEM